MTASSKNTHISINESKNEDNRQKKLAGRSTEEAATLYDLAVAGTGVPY